MKHAFFYKKYNKFTSRFGSISPLSQTFIWFEKYWLDNKFGFQEFSFADLFKACDKAKFPHFCRKHILYDSRASIGRYTKKLRSYAKYFFDALLGPDRKFDVCFDPIRGKILKTRVAMTFSEISDELVGFIDNMDPTTGEIFESVGYNSMYTNLAGRSSEYVVPMFGILKFVAHSCRDPVKISRKPLNRSIMGNRYKCIQMLISRDKRSEVLNAGDEIVMDYCYAENQLPFSCCCSKCVVNLVDT